MPLDQRCNVAVLSSGQQIAFPVARDRSVFRFRWPFADRDGIDDLPPCMSMLAEMARATHAPLRPQVVHQLFFQYATRLVAKPIAKLVRPHHGHDRQDGRHGVRSLGSLSRWHDSDHGRSRESTSRKRSLAKYLLAQRG